VRSTAGNPICCKTQWARSLLVKPSAKGEVELSVVRPSRRLVALALLLLCSAITPIGSAQTVQIPPGMRLVEIHLARNLPVAPGDYVDVLVTAKQGRTRTVLHNVKVAATDQGTRVVAFLVSPDDAQKVMAAGEQGKFRLSRWKSN